MNKKLFILAIGVGLALTACSSQKKAADGKDAQDTSKTEFSVDEPDVQMTGAYTKYRALSKEDKAIFDDTYKGDVKLTPQKVATQVVAGTNYSFICKDAKGGTYEVVIFEPLPGQGKPEVSEVTKK